MFDRLENQTCDFWGITSHKQMVPNPFTGKGILPRHIQSHFIAFRRRLLNSADFVQYWRDMPKIESYLDSILLHESRLTQHFESIGYSSFVYIDDRHYGSHHPCFINIDETIRDRCPILKRRPFFYDHNFLEEHAIDLPRAIRLVRENSDYDEQLIWKSIVRSCDLRTLNTNAALMSVLPDKRLKPEDAPYGIGNVAVFPYLLCRDGGRAAGTQ
jgi:lipopolysaccharide biosynthesis protein